MKELENLKDLYLEEIKKITKKGELTPVDAEAATKALDAIKKIEDICCYEEDMEEGYSSRRSYGRMYSHGRMPEMYPEYYSDRRGRSATTGRYISRHDGRTVDKMIRKLEDLKVEAPDTETAMAIDNVICKLEDC